jgi:ferredoxin
MNNNIPHDHITLDGRNVPMRHGQTILEVARQAGLDIPTLCFLEKCGPLNTCQVCLVKVDGRLAPSCGIPVRPGMVVESETPEVHEARRTALELLFSDHVGDCLAPCQRLCPLGLNIPVLLRQVKADAASDAIQTIRTALPLAGVLGRLCHHPCEQGCRRGHWDDPATIRDIERSVVDADGIADEPFVPPSRSQKDRNVVIVGAGPVGLAAAFSLAQKGCRVSVLDRNSQAGGSLRNLPEVELPKLILEREITLLEKMGVTFRMGTALGIQVKVSELCEQYDAVLLALGELSGGEAKELKLPVVDSSPSPPSHARDSAYLRVDPRTLQTSTTKLFAAGAVVRAVPQLVRAIAEGKTAAECIDGYLNSGKPARPGRPFSSVMGRLQPEELKKFLSLSNPVALATPCDTCAGLNRAEASLAASRCLHCDCNSSGNCTLQYYAQVYNADANRFRSERRPFERQMQPGGVVFEPGKCILCGICVKLTEMAAEPLGLTFVGRGFDVRIAAPLNHELEDGLRKTAAECVEFCPTGALSFRRT